MIQIKISDTFTKDLIVRQPVRCRTSNKEKSDLTPLNRTDIKSIIGQSKGSTIVGKGQIKGISLVKRQLEPIEGYVLKQRLNHSFIGHYTFDRLTGKIEKSLKRDLMALVLQKAKQVRIEITGLESGSYIIKRENCSDYNGLFNKVKNIILINQKENVFSAQKTII